MRHPKRDAARLYATRHATSLQTLYTLPATIPGAGRRPEVRPFHANLGRGGAERSEYPPYPEPPPTGSPAGVCARRRPFGIAFICEARSACALP